MDTYVLHEKIKSFICSGYHHSKNAHKAIFNSKLDNSIAITYLNLAISAFSNGESFYYSHYDDLANSETESIFFQFQIFAKEMINNIATSHSHQWTDLEFNNLTDKIDSSPLYSFEHL